MIQHTKSRILLACLIFSMIFGLCGFTSAMAGNAKIGMLTGNATGGYLNLQILNPPEGMGGDPATGVGVFKNVSNTIVDAAGGEVDGSDGAEFVVLMEKANGVNSLSIFDLPAEGTAGLGQPVAGDNNMGRNNEFIAIGNFDSDPEMEAVILRKKRSGTYKLLVFNLPKTPGENIGKAIASDFNIGRGITALCSGNFDSDAEDELVIIRKVNGKSKLQVYNAPINQRGSTGAPLLSYVNIERDIIANGLAVGAFDNYATDARIALVFSEEDNSHSLEIFDHPRMRGDRLPQAIAGYSNIGIDIVSITSLRPPAEDNTRVNEAPKAAIRADLLRGQAPLTVFFDGRDSFDSDGFIQSYRWGLENGDLGQAETLEYEFTTPGVYAITLTVTDNEGAQNSAQISIEVTDTGNDVPDSDLNPEEEELLSLINGIRQDNGLSPLNYVKELGIAARRHSDDMAQNNFMSHTGSNGSSPWDRMADAGYQYYTAGENVAAGYSSPNSVATGWMNSPGHRANILNPNFCEIGSGYAYEANSSYRHYWTLDLGCSI